jgi:hypothetical protein
MAALMITLVATAAHAEPRCTITKLQVAASTDKELAGGPGIWQLAR